MPLEHVQFKRHGIDGLAFNGLEFNRQDNIGDVSASVVVKFCHHEVSASLHVMRLHGDGVPRKHPIPTAQDHNEQHEKNSSCHGDTRGCHLPLEGGEQFRCFLGCLPILELVALEC